jgi:hypothetical protein
MELHEKLLKDELNYQSFAPGLVHSRHDDILFRRNEVLELYGSNNLFKVFNVKKHKINNKNIGFLVFQDKNIFFEQDERGISWNVIIPGNKKEYGMAMLTGYDAKWISEFTLETIDKIKASKGIVSKPKNKIKI